MANSAKILSLATAVPPHVLAQDEVISAARDAFGGRVSEFERLAGVFETAGIARRYGVRPIGWYLEPRGWRERSEAYLEGATALFTETAAAALAEAGLSGADVDTVVTVSSTGIATPSLEARVAARLGFRRDVQRVPVFGLGCAGGVSGLAIASRLARARPGTIVLVVVVELCTLAFRLDKTSKANIVATALFGDGAAACVLKAGGGGLAEVTGAGEYTWPDTLDIMGWTVDGEGLGVVFDRAIPPFAEAHLREAVSAILAGAGMDQADVDRFICHPGGAKVILALERALSLRQGALDHERAILSDFGNMSAPTALFVLERAVKAGLPERAVMTALGPGFTASCVALARSQ